MKNIRAHYSTPIAYEGLSLTVLKVRKVICAETARGHRRMRLVEEKGNRFELLGLHFSVCGLG